MSEGWSQLYTHPSGVSCNAMYLRELFLTLLTVLGAQVRCPHSVLPFFIMALITLETT